MKAFIFLMLLIGIISCDDRSKSSVNNGKDKSKIIATIDYEDQGCFGGQSLKLVIIDQNGEKSALLTAGANEMERAIIDENGITAYNQFIKELKEKDFDSGCTTTAYYSVTLVNEKFKKVDGSCSWNGFENLQKSLFNR